MNKVMPPVFENEEKILHSHDDSLLLRYNQRGCEESPAEGLKV